MKLAVPDLVSNSYFLCVAAKELGCFKAQDLDVTVTHVSPVEGCAAALRDGKADVIGASAHAPLTAFPQWKGAKLLCAQSQGMYWFLVMRADLGVARGDLAALAGKRIVAVPFVAAALRQVLAAAGIDPQAQGIAIESPASALKPGVNFGVAAADALAKREIDGFFANGMGAALATSRGVGTIVLDIRRGDGPQECFDYTMPAIATTDAMIAREPDSCAGIVRAIAEAQRILKTDVSEAKNVARNIFPAAEAALIQDIVARDLPYYSPALLPASIAAINRYAHAAGLLDTPSVPYDDVVATQFCRFWTS